ECRSGAPFFHGGESARVAKMIAAGGDSDVVAAVFTFGAHALIQPPNRRMEKEKRFRSDLEKVDEGIEAANVREFVGDDGFDLVFCKSGQGANGKKDDGSEIANDGRSIKPTAFAEFDYALQAEARLQFAALGEKRRADRNGSGTAKAFEIDQAARGAKCEEENTGEPDLNHQGKNFASKGLHCRRASQNRLNGFCKESLLREDDDRRRGGFRGLQSGLGIQQQNERDGYGSDHAEQS